MTTIACPLCHESVAIIAPHPMQRRIHSDGHHAPPSRLEGHGKDHIFIRTERADPFDGSSGRDVLYTVTVPCLASGAVVTKSEKPK